MEIETRGSPETRDTLNLSRVFTIVGIAFGALFVVLNAADLPDAWPTVAWVMGIVLVAAAIWFGLIRGVHNDGPVHDQQSIRTYWTAVIAEVIAIPAGALVINAVFDRPRFVVLWIVFVVGAHFLPARAFGMRGFTGLGIGMIALAIVCAVLTLAWTSTAAPIGGVLAGFLLLGFTIVTGRRGLMRPTV